MKWPFVRRSKYENAMIYGINTAREITEKTSYLHKLEDQIEIYKKLHDEYAQLNHNYMVEINRVNQELASELNSHRETKKLSQQRLDAYNTLNHKYRCLVKELEETKDALKIAQEDLEKESKNHLKTYAIFKDTKRKIYNILKESL